jgi:predicted 3-demethylubiquinone-9 3-methyltransferase (glyoxalase superfamily)
VHDFTFTPSTSFFVSCDSDSEVDRLFGALSDGGSILMGTYEESYSIKLNKGAR